MINKKILPIILSGGTGSRLWPLSRASFPKQYLSLDERSEYSLLQNTSLRLQNINFKENPLIITNEEQRFIVAEQMRALKIKPKAILLEPFGKNTCPAIALTALISQEEGDDPLLLILPSDHKINENHPRITQDKHGKRLDASSLISCFSLRTRF